MTSHTSQHVELGAEAWLTAPTLQRVFDALEISGSARVAGGAVRDALLGRPVSDVDIATTLPPEQVVQFLNDAGIKSVPTGLSHGTVTAVVGESDTDVYQITTLRLDIETDGRRSKVAFTDDWEADASRRDFTMNALFCDRHGELYDPLGGYGDLLSGRVRFVGEPRVRIEEDYLRILRFFRFNAVLGGGSIDEAGLEACIALKEGLKRLSRERIRQELFRLLVAGEAVSIVATMERHSILAQVLPSPSNLERLSRLCDIEAGNGFEPDALLRLVALALAEPSDVDVLRERFVLSNDETRRLAALDLTCRYSDVDDDEAKARLYGMGAAAYRDDLLISWAGSGDDNQDARWSRLADLPQRWTAPKFPLSGEDVLALGVEAGPQVGDALREVEAWWVRQGFPEDETLLRRHLASLTRTRYGTE